MTSHDTTLAGTDRIRGLDLARGLAVIGMFAAHVLLLDDFDWTDPNTWGGVVNGRSAATFAVLAGVSIAIISGGLTPARSVALTRARVRIAVRAVLIFAIGVLLTALGTNVYIILEFYAVMFVMALPVLRWRTRTLFTVAGVLAVVSPIAQLVLSRVFETTSLYDTLLVTLLVTGAYPAIVWFVFVLVGIGLGRLELRQRDIQLKMLAWGVALAIVGYTAGSLLAPLNAAGAAGASPSGLFDLSALLTALPHTGSPFEVVGATGFAMALLALCLLVMRPTTPRVLRGALYPLVATGSMALTAYTAQIISLWAIGDDYWVVGQNNAGLYFSLTVPIVLLCSLWAWIVGRGPLERLLTTTSHRVSAVVTRRGPEVALDRVRNPRR